MGYAPRAQVRVDTIDQSLNYWPYNVQSLKYWPGTCTLFYRNSCIQVPSHGSWYRNIGVRLMLTLLVTWRSGSMDLIHWTTNNNINETDHRTKCRHWPDAAYEYTCAILKKCHMILTSDLILRQLVNVVRYMRQWRHRFILDLHNRLARRSPTAVATKHSPKRREHASRTRTIDNNITWRLYALCSCRHLSFERWWCT